MVWILSLCYYRSLRCISQIFPLISGIRYQVNLIVAASVMDAEALTVHHVRISTSPSSPEISDRFPPVSSLFFTAKTCQNQPESYSCHQLFQVLPTDLTPYLNISLRPLQGHLNLRRRSMLNRQGRFCCASLIPETKPTSPALLFISLTRRSVLLSLSSGPIMQRALSDWTTYCFGSQDHCVRDCVYLSRCVCM